MNANNKTYVPYTYHHASIPGGGFVTGFCFHPKESGILYTRTDIGGAYRYEFSTGSWISLIDHVTAISKWESYPLSIALDPQHPDWLYIAAGDLKNNFLCRSKNRGEHFEYFPIPAGIHGNAPGRGTGERLAVDPCNPSILYFGSQTEGLLISEDYGETWTGISVKPADGRAETDMAFVWLDPRSERNGRCQTIVVSTSGKENSPGDNRRAESLYISRDAGLSFSILPGQPSAGDYGNYPGFVGQRATFSGKYLFITMSAIERARIGWSSYACDNGGNNRGCVIRYELFEDGTIGSYQLVTPDLTFMGGNNAPISEITGFGGICADVNHPGYLICTTQCFVRPDAVLISLDYGEHWTPILYDLKIGKIDFSEVSYMKPEYNNNGSLIHWLSDIQIDPFHSDRTVFNTGTGIFMTENLMDCLSGKPILWRPCCKGVEETVHLNVYSPPGGDVKLIDIVGDLGGFAFRNLNEQAENSFADESNNRYITCLNADYSDFNPEHVAVTARGNWTGLTTGGLIWSTDQCRTFQRLPDPIHITNRIDKLIEAIRRPNTNSGWTAISSDNNTLVWCVGEKFKLPMEAVVYTQDLGKTWSRSLVYDAENQLIEAGSATMKVMSDRVDPEVFYGFGDDSAMYISSDRAVTFRQIPIPDHLPRCFLGGIDGYNIAEIRAESGRAGVVWIAFGEGGLWRITFKKEKISAVFEQISKAGDKIFRQGMGMPAPDSKFHTIYVNGIIDGSYGFYRSLDEGKSWQRINHEKQMYGDIRGITGDPRCFGRFYIASGSRGVLWGEPEV